ncbi:hypothetical protein PAXRUDRAFT_140375 [Paxillus rubicundulus Ve08.2h10]|uniref:Uncharacterized protein n=1 Tax=Paxillus rubicundulus Ve08.2h10 TaxID=930991 RepID=A0A0D0DYZ5_9AGAM|nr:hypothetical protein PAXRUDRAFT_140375 [Paxillus rubicundulus Ve08.2h10]
MLSQSYELHQAVNLFLASADELYGPITTIRWNGQVTKHIPWMAFSLKASNWEWINDTHSVIVLC